MRSGISWLVVATAFGLLACSSESSGSSPVGPDQSGSDAATDSSGPADASVDAPSADAPAPSGPLCDRPAPGAGTPLSSTCAEGAGSFIAGGTITAGRYHLVSATVVRGNAGQCAGFTSTSVAGALDVFVVDSTHYEFVEVASDGGAPSESRFVGVESASGSGNLTFSAKCGTTTTNRGEYVATPSSLSLIKSGAEPETVLYER
jgi:hypothetical protein